MISLFQLYQSGAPTGSNIYITNLGMEVSRKFLNDSFSYANTYAFDFEGNIFDANFQEGQLSQTLEDKIKTIAETGKFNYRIKSISFPNEAAGLSENIRFLKFNMSVEFQERTNDYSRFIEITGVSGFSGSYTGVNQFNNLIPTIWEDSGEFIEDLSETFSFDEGDGGEGKFSHSLNFTLLPVTGGSIDTLIQSKYLQTAAKAIATGSTNYSTFVNISELFTGQGFFFNKDFFTQHTGRMTHTETADILSNSYSVTRSKTYYTGYNQFYCLDHNYNLTVGSNGEIEVSEETKMEGETDYIDLLNKFNTEVEAPSASVTNGVNVFLNVKKSHDRCVQFLSGYHKFLRLRKSESDSAVYFEDYTNSTGLYSLKPFPIEKTLVSVPELPSLIYNIKYTTSPNINFGYESTEGVSTEKNGTIFEATYDAKVKVFSFQTGDFLSFDSSLGSKAGVTNFATFVSGTQNGLLKKSNIFVHNLINGDQDVSLKNLRPNAELIPLALIKKSSSLSRRGKDFSLTLSYSSDNKYAPLYFRQDPKDLYVIDKAPDKSKMFENLIIPRGLGVSRPIHKFLAENFTFIDKKVSTTVPVEKFIQRVVMARPQGVAIIEPSVQSSTGKMSISFNLKIDRKNYNFFEGGQVSLTAAGKYVKDVKTLLSDLFSPINSNFSPIFHATVSTEIAKILDVNANGGLHPINGYVPTSINYKFDSDFNLEISVEVEFYSKSVGGKRKPIFGFHGNKDYGNSIVTKNLFNQQNSY